MITIMVAGTVIQWTHQGCLPRFPASLNLIRAKRMLGVVLLHVSLGFIFLTCIMHKLTLCPSA